MISNNESIQLICLPYAGGSAYCFQPLTEFWPENWRVSTISYPGRGERMGASLVYDMESLVEDCWIQIKGKIDKPYAILGHSLGSCLTYLLAHKIELENGPAPIHLFLSGTDAPSTPVETPYRYLLSKKAFQEKLLSYGGISNEILNNAEAFDFFEPIIRADFQAVETWKYKKRGRLTIPATIITGTEEKMKAADIQRWQDEFDTKIKFNKLPGNHFFLFEHPKAFVDIIAKDLKHTLKSKRTNLIKEWAH